MAKKRSAAPPPAPEAPPQFGPAESAAALKKLYRRSPHIADAAKLILHWAERTIEAFPDPEHWQWGDLKPPTDRTLVALNCDELAGAIAALDALNLPKETRQEFDKMIRETFAIGRMLGNLEQALAARKGMPQAHQDRVQAGRVRKAEARLALELKIIKDNKWSLKQGDLPGKLQSELYKRTGKRWSPTTIRRDIDFHSATTR
jgi:hypothetical protein